VYIRVQGKREKKKIGGNAAESEDKGFEKNFSKVPLSSAAAPLSSYLFVHLVS